MRSVDSLPQKGFNFYKVFSNIIDTVFLFRYTAVAVTTPLRTKASFTTTIPSPGPAWRPTLAWEERVSHSPTTLPSKEMLMNKEKREHSFCHTFQSAVSTAMCHILIGFPSERAEISCFLTQRGDRRESHSLLQALCWVRINVEGPFSLAPIHIIQTQNKPVMRMLYAL